MKKKRVALRETEWRLVLYALNELRNSRIAEGRYTDFIDELMVKIAKAPVKKVRSHKVA